MQFVIDQAEKWQRLNEEKQNQFEQEKSPSVVVDFIKHYPQALQEQWISGIVVEWLLEGRQDLLKPIFSLGRGENVDTYKRDLENLMILDKIIAMRAKEGIDWWPYLEFIVDRINEACETMDSVLLSDIFLDAARLLCKTRRDRTV